MQRFSVLLEIAPHANAQILIDQMRAFSFKTCAFRATVNHVDMPICCYCWNQLTNTETPQRLQDGICLCIVRQRG